MYKKRLPKQPINQLYYTISKIDLSAAFKRATKAPEPVSFYAAIESLKSGKVVESCSGKKYKLINGDVKGFSIYMQQYLSCCGCFSFDEMTNVWRIY